MKSSKRQIYNKVSKFLTYEIPIHVYPLQEKFHGLLIFQDVVINQID